MRTLLLDLTNWDLLTDASGNIAVAEDPYAIAQSVASACRAVQGECWYDTTIGIPYFQQILGQSPPAGLVKAQLIAAALTVPGVNNPVVYLTGLAGRQLTGQVQFTDANGATQAVVF